jgi:peptidoglycan-N-acetylglucosamine deacetylase
MENVKRHWPKKATCALSLTYDDGLENHLTVVAPALEKFGLRGTFYTPIKSNIMQDPLAWRALAKKGHELGNHTVFHPCWSVGGKYSEWLQEDFNLENYTAEKWLDEVNTANQQLWLVDGKQERTFGNTCFDNYLGPESNPICLEPLISQVFLAARGEESAQPVNLKQINYANLGTIWADHRVFADFSSELGELLDTGGWIIYTMHGVGAGSNAEFIEVEEHRRLLAFLHEAADKIWIAPVIDVVRYLKKISR